MTSLPINVAKVSSVLLSDGWHKVKSGTFKTGRYYYEEKFSGVAEIDGYTVGFVFIKPLYGGKHEQIAGPIESILAVRIS